MTQCAGVLGAGTMGVGIAYVFAVAGYETTVVEPSSDRISHVRRQLGEVAADGVRRERLDESSAAATLRRLRFAQSIEEVPRGAAIIVETVSERADLKREVLTAAEDREPHILSTNTSALSVDDLASSLRSPDRFLGTHFFNPVWSIGLVELVRGEATSREVLDLASQIVRRLGKESAIVSDTPGFATSRLDLVAALEAMRMVESNVASAEDIDRAMRVAYRHPVGPLRLSDIVGLDVRLDIAQHLAGQLGRRFEPPQLLVDMVARGDLGEKSGQGFYAWPE